MTFKNCLVRFFKEDEGASGIEYALIATMVAVVIALFVPTIAPLVNAIFVKIQAGLT